MNPPLKVTAASEPTTLPTATPKPKKRPAAKRAKAPRAAAKARTPKTAKAKRTPAKAKRAPKTRPYARTGTFAFEARSWKDPATVKAELNPKAKKVYAALGPVKSAPKTIAQLADKAFPTAPKTKRTSWVRNSLRRMRDGKLVKRVDAGTYQKAA